MYERENFSYQLPHKVAWDVDRHRALGKLPVLKLCAVSDSGMKAKPE